MNEPTQVQIPAAKGLNTWAARGSTDQPFVLTGGVLRQGGWACAPKARLLKANVLAGVWAGYSNELFLQTTAGIEFFNPNKTLPLSGPLQSSVDNAFLDTPVVLAPRLVYVDMQNKGVYLSPLFGVREVLHSATITQWNGTGNPPAGPWYRVTEGNGKIQTKNEIRIRLVPVRGPDAPATSPYQGATEVVIPATSANARNIQFGNITWPVNIYANILLPGSTNNHFQFWQTNSTGKNLVTDFYLESAPTGNEISNSTMYINAISAEYHQSRVWAFGAPRMYNATADNPMDYAVINPGRVYYSDIISGINDVALPFFAEDYYIDVPLKVSTTIVAIKSAGRYLYIIGDKEVWVLSGNDDETFTLECLGDSIGAVSQASVQTLQNNVIYLSDSTVIILAGGQIADVGNDVRDLLFNLDTSKLSATVDFKQEQYLISDGSITLIYHLREQGWSQRLPDGEHQQLIYAGGTPYSIYAQNLTSLDDKTLLPMTLSFGPFGVSKTRRLWRGVSMQLDSDTGGEIAVQLNGHDVDMSQALIDTATDVIGQTAGSGVTPVLLSLGRDGVGVTASLATITLTVAPHSTAQRCILKPPLEIMAVIQGEAWAK